MRKKMIQSQTQDNIQLLLDSLKERKSHDFHRLTEPLTDLDGALTKTEADFLKFWHTMPFFAYHGTSYFEDIKRTGKLLPVLDREKVTEQSTTNSHTKNLARQSFVYFSLGLRNISTVPGFVGSNPAIISLPLTHLSEKARQHPLYAQISNNCWITNHDVWFNKTIHVDPIEINGVRRSVSFDEKLRQKIYRYENQVGVDFSRIVSAEQETFCAEGDFSQLIQVLGLQFILELSFFGGEFRQKILTKPETQVDAITRLFNLLFPSEIYPEINIQSAVPLDFPDLHITPSEPLNQEKINRLHQAAKKGGAKEIKNLLTAGVSIDALMKVGSYDMQTPVITALKAYQFEVAKEFIRQGARLQTISLNHIDNILTVLLDLDYSSEFNSKKEAFIAECLSGISNLFLPEVKQHFDLARPVSQKNFGMVGIIGTPTLIKLLYLYADKPQDPIWPYLNNSLKRYDYLGLFSHIYSESRHKEPFSFLLKKLVEFKCDINQPHLHKQKTLLQLAAAKQDTSTMEWAVAHGATILLPSQLYSPFLSAIESGSLTSFQWLTSKNSVFTQADYEILTEALKEAEIEHNQNLQIEKQTMFECTGSQELSNESEISQFDFFNYNIAIKQKKLLNMVKIAEIIKSTELGQRIFTSHLYYATKDYAAGVILFVTFAKETYTLLVGKQDSYCGPGGLIEKHERRSFALGVARELEEETGLKAKITGEPIVFEHIQAETSFQLIHKIYIEDLGELKELPPLKASDDVRSAEWVPIRQLSTDGPMTYRNLPVWHSNMLIIRARQKNIPVDAELVSQALFNESVAGHQAFEVAIINDDEKSMNLALQSGLWVRDTNAVFIAASRKKPSILDKLLANGGDINIQSRNGMLPLIGACLFTLKCNLPFSWINTLIDQYKAKWYLMGNSFECNSIVQAILETSTDFRLLTQLIKRKDDLSVDFFAHCLAAIIKADQPYLLFLLMSTYKVLTKNELQRETALTTAAESASVPMFRALLKQGAMASPELIKKIKNSAFLAQPPKSIFIPAGMFPTSPFISKSPQLMSALKEFKKIDTADDASSSMLLS